MPEQLPLKTMAADVLFLDPADVNAGIAALIDLDFDAEIRDGFDVCGPAVFVAVRGCSRLADDDFFDWLEGILAPLGGTLLEAGEDTIKPGDIPRGTDETP